MLLLALIRDATNSTGINRLPTRLVLQQSNHEFSRICEPLQLVGRANASVTLRCSDSMQTIDDAENGKSRVRL